MTRGAGRSAGYRFEGRPVPLDYAAPAGTGRARREWRFPLTWSALLVAGVLLFVGSLVLLLLGTTAHTDGYLLAGAVLTMLSLGLCCASRAGTRD